MPSNLDAPSPEEVQEIPSVGASFYDLNSFLDARPATASRYAEVKNRVELTIQFLEGLVKDTDKMAQTGRLLLDEATKTQQQANEYLVRLRETTMFLEDRVMFAKSQKKSS
jgi:hypothetical protein